MNIEGLHKEYKPNTVTLLLLRVLVNWHECRGFFYRAINNPSMHAHVNTISSRIVDIGILLPSVIVIVLAQIMTLLKKNRFIARFKHSAKT